MLCVFSDPSTDHVVRKPEFVFNVVASNHSDLLTSVEFSEETIIDSITDMASNSSPGPDGLHASIFKNCAKSLVKLLQILFESMFEKNCILERIIRKQVVAFLESRSLLNPTQHGFRAKRSCLSALLDVYDSILESLTHGASCVDMVYLDFAKASNKVDHDILLH